MSDIVERLRTHCIDLEGGIRDEEILAAADEHRATRRHTHTGGVMTVVGTGGMVAQAAGGAWREFAKRGYADAVECVTTSEEVEFEDGVFCTVQVSVKFIPANQPRTLREELGES